MSQEQLLFSDQSFADFKSAKIKSIDQHITAFFSEEWATMHNPQSSAEMIANLIIVPGITIKRDKAEDHFSEDLHLVEGKNISYNPPRANLTVLVPYSGYYELFKVWPDETPLVDAPSGMLLDDKIFIRLEGPLDGQIMGEKSNKHLDSIQEIMRRLNVKLAAFAEELPALVLERLLLKIEETKSISDRFSRELESFNKAKQR